MKAFLITYTLDSPESYGNISQRIKSYEKWARISDKSWLIKTDSTAIEIRSALKESIEENGRIFVIEVSGASWATFAISRNVTNWMRENL